MGDGHPHVISFTGVLKRPGSRLRDFRAGRNAPRRKEEGKPGRWEEDDEGGSDLAPADAGDLGPLDIEIGAIDAEAELRAHLRELDDQLTSLGLIVLDVQEQQKAIKSRIKVLKGRVRR